MDEELLKKLRDNLINIITDYDPDMLDETGKKEINRLVLEIYMKGAEDGIRSERKENDLFAQ